MSQKIYDNAQDIGARFRSARSLVRLTRKSFCEKHGISKFTVQAWENGRHVSRGANLQKFCDALRNEGVLCRPEWLIDGDGSAPARLFAGDLMSEEQEEIGSSASDLIQLEIEAFCATYEKAGSTARVVSVADTFMSPIYEKGHYVGGRCLYGSEIDSLIGHICIVEVHENRFLLRRLMKDGDKYYLLSNRFEEGLMALNKVFSAAKVSWHRII